ncbi:MAG: hypothetical protein WAS07_07450 [Micropruina sp.]
MTFQQAGVKAVAAVGLLAILGYIGFLAWAAYYESYNVWGSLLVIPIVLALNLPFVLAVARKQPDRVVAWLIGISFGLRVLGSLARYYVTFVVYGGSGDANAYNSFAASMYELWRRGIFVGAPEAEVGSGTAFLKMVTTAVYTVIGPAPMAGFIAFSVFAYWGTYLIFRAFQLAVPFADLRRYAYLIFLLPSILYWPSSIGKEAWLMLFVGLFAYGAAKIWCGHQGGAIPLLIGLLGITSVRPHLAVLLVFASVVGQALRPLKNPLGIFGKVFGLLILAGAGALVWGQTVDLLGGTETVGDDVSGTLANLSERTGQGGSTFTPVPISSPFGIPTAIATVLFRPFVWEANNPQLLLAAGESLVLLVLLALSWKRFRQFPKYWRTSPFMVFSITYVLGFIVAFSSFSNFGILVRQRVLMLPFFLVLLALPKPVQPSVYAQQEKVFARARD